MSCVDLKVKELTDGLARKFDESLYFSLEGKEL